MSEIKRISCLKPLSDYRLDVIFDDGKRVIYDVKKDFDNPGYMDLKSVPGLFEQVQLDESRTDVSWNEYIDLPSHAIYEHGEEIDPPHRRITIKEIRVYTGLSQAKFGELYHIPRRTIANWELGINEPPLYVLEMLERIVREDFKVSHK